MASGALIYFLLVHLLDLAEMRVTAQQDMMMAIVAELLTICMIPLTLKAHKLAFLKNNLTNLQLFVMRMAVIEFLVLMNTTCYMLTCNATFSWLAGMALLSFAFLFPTRTED